MKKNYSLILLAVFTVHFTHSQDLMSYIQEAEANNLELKALGYKHDVALEKINEVNTLPDTELGIGVFVSEPETRTGAQKMRFSLKQMMPWFGTITARQNYSSTMATVAFENLVLAQRKLRMAVAQSYYKLYAIQSKKDVLKNHIQLVERYETIVLNSVEVGQTSLVDVLKLQMKREELLRQKELLEQNFWKEQAAFNLLLNRDSGVTVAVVSDLKLPAQDRVVDTSTLDLHPELVQFDRLYASVTDSELVNKKEAAPTIGFGLDYINVEARQGLDFIDNGKDILMPMFSIRLPIFNHKYRSKTVQNSLKQDALLAEKSNRKNQLTTILIAALSERQIAKISHDTYTSNIEKAEFSLDLLIKNFEVQNKNFTDVLDLQELLLNLEVSKIEAVQSYYSQSTIINYLSNQ